MVRVGEDLWCTYMASELKEAKYLEDKLNILAKSCNLFHDDKPAVMPHPATRETCYAFKGLEYPDTVYIFPSEGNTLHINLLNENTLAKITSSTEKSTVIKVEDSRFIVYKNYLDTIKIADAKIPGFYAAWESDTKK